MNIPEARTNPGGGVTPRWIRIPKGGTRCPYSGLTRSHVYQLIKNGKIRAVTLREGNQIRGVRLVDAASLLAYIDRNAIEGGVL